MKFCKSLSICILFILLSGCNDSNNTFPDYNEALTFIYNEHNIEEKDILETIELNGYHFLLFNQHSPSVFGVTVLIEENGVTKIVYTTPKLDISNNPDGVASQLTIEYIKEGYLTFLVGNYLSEENFNMFDKEFNYGNVTKDKQRQIFYNLEIK